MEVEGCAWRSVRSWQRRSFLSARTACTSIILPHCCTTVRMHYYSIMLLYYKARTFFGAPQRLHLYSFGRWKCGFAPSGIEGAGPHPEDSLGRRGNFPLAPPASRSGKEPSGTWWLKAPNVGVKAPVFGQTVIVCDCKASMFDEKARPCFIWRRCNAREPSC